MTPSEGQAINDHQSSAGNHELGTRFKGEQIVDIIKSKFSSSHIRK